MTPRRIASLLLAPVALIGALAITATSSPVTLGSADVEEISPVHALPGSNYVPTSTVRSRDLVFATGKGAIVATPPGTTVVIDWTETADDVSVNAQLLLPAEPDEASATTWTEEALDQIFDAVRDGEPLLDAVTAAEDTLVDLDHVSTHPATVVARPRVEIGTTSTVYAEAQWNVRMGHKSRDGERVRPQDHGSSIESHHGDLRATSLRMASAYDPATVIDIDYKPSNYSTVTNWRCTSKSVSTSHQTQVAAGPVKAGTSYTVSTSREICPETIAPSKTRNTFVVTWEGERKKGQLASIPGVHTTVTPADLHREPHFTLTATWKKETSLGNAIAILDRLFPGSLRL